MRKLHTPQRKVQFALVQVMRSLSAGLKDAAASKDSCLGNLITVREDTPVSEIATIFTEKEINRVPVTDDGGKLLGIVAREDIVKLSFPKV